MSRIEENQILAEKVKGTYDKISDAKLASILLDISKSLAVIADACNPVQAWPSTKLCGNCKHWEEDDDNPNSVCHTCRGRENWEANNGN